MHYLVTLEFESGIRVVCKLMEHPELRKLLAKSPFNAKAERWGDEIYFELPVKLELRGERTLMDVGEVAYWPEGNSLCIFFGPTPISRGEKPVAYSEVKPLGKVVEGLEYLREVKGDDTIYVRIEAE
ncbi:MAG: cyclophilin-like fold protein [Candidatus Bathyarchaeia archaeon]